VGGLRDQERPTNAVPNTNDAVASPLQRTFRNAGRILGIIRPFRRVIVDVLAYAGEVVVPADDVFVIVALPDGRARCLSDGVDPFCRRRFEGADDGA